MNPTLNPDETTGEVRVTPRVVLGLVVMFAGLVLALDSLGFSLVELSEYVRCPLRIVRIDSRHDRLLSGSRPDGCGSRALRYEGGTPHCSWRAQ